MGDSRLVGLHGSYYFDDGYGHYFTASIYAEYDPEKDAIVKIYADGYSREEVERRIEELSGKVAEAAEKLGIDPDEAWAFASGGDAILGEEEEKKLVEELGDLVEKAMYLSALESILDHLESLDIEYLEPRLKTEDGRTLKELRGT